MKNQSLKIDKPATATEIRKIVGTVSDEIIVAILNTRATPAEVLGAFEWEEQDEYIGAGPDGPEGRIKVVYDILREDRELFGDEEDSHHSG